MLVCHQLGEHVKARYSTITDLQLRVATLERLVETLQGTVGSDSTITDLQSRSATLEGTVETLQGTVATLKGQYAEQPSREATLEGTVEMLQGTVATLKGQDAEQQALEAARTARIMMGQLGPHWDAICVTCVYLADKRRRHMNIGDVLEISRQPVQQLREMEGKPGTFEFVRRGFTPAQQLRFQKFEAWLWASHSLTVDDLQYYSKQLKDSRTHDGHLLDVVPTVTVQQLWAWAEEAVAAAVADNPGYLGDVGQALREAADMLIPMVEMFAGEVAATPTTPQIPATPYVLSISTVSHSRVKALVGVQ